MKSMAKNQDGRPDWAGKAKAMRARAARMPETKAGREAKAFLLDSAKTLDKAARIKRRVPH